VWKLKVRSRNVSNFQLTHHMENYNKVRVLNSIVLSGTFMLFKIWEYKIERKSAKIRDFKVEYKMYKILCLLYLILTNLVNHFNI